VVSHLVTLYSGVLPGFLDHHDGARTVVNTVVGHGTQKSSPQGPEPSRSDDKHAWLDVLCQGEDLFLGVTLEKMNDVQDLAHEKKVG